MSIVDFKSTVTVAFALGWIECAKFTPTASSNSADDYPEVRESRDTQKTKTVTSMMLLGTVLENLE